MLKMNEALDLNRRDDIMGKVDMAVSVFADDIRSKIGWKEYPMELHIDEKSSDTLVITWHWGSNGPTTEKKFRLQVTDTADTFVNAVKAYLFDMIMMIVSS